MCPGAFRCLSAFPSWRQIGSAGQRRSTARRMQQACARRRTHAAVVRSSLQRYTRTQQSVHSPVSAVWFDEVGCDDHTAAPTRDEWFLPDLRGAAEQIFLRLFAETSWFDRVLVGALGRRYRLCFGGTVGPGRTKEFCVSFASQACTPPRKRAVPRACQERVAMQVLSAQTICVGCAPAHQGSLQDVDSFDSPSINGELCAEVRCMLPRLSRRSITETLCAAGQQLSALPGMPAESASCTPAAIWKRPSAVVVSVLRARHGCQHSG